MRRPSRWMIVLAICAAAVALIVGLEFEASQCTYRESDPAYSPDKKFYSQMQFTMCRDHSKSRARLVMGTAGKPEKAVILDFRPSFSALDISWHDGPELHVQVPASDIIERYSPYEELPRVVITNP